MDELLSRQLPHSIEAEQSVLGAMLIDASCISVVVEILRPEDFFMTQNRHIFETIYSMFTLNETIDAVTVLNKLEVRGLADAAGGKRYLLELMDITPTAANVKLYVKIVKDKATLRALGEVSGEISNLVISGEGEANEIVEVAEQKIYAIRNSKEHKGLASISSVIMNVYDQLDVLAKNQGKVPGVSSGFRSIDNTLNGFNNSDLIILAARPAMGKTSLALNLAINGAKTSGKAVVIFSLEMSNEQLAMRLISSESFVDSKKLRTGMLSDDEWVSIAHAASELSKLKMFLDDTSDITVPEMKAKCRRLGDELGMIVIDYLQLMSMGKHSDNRVQEISAISRSLKIMAKELGVPVLCLSQLSRGPENRKDNDRKPRLADLRETGAIEQDADIVLFIYRDDYYTKEESEKPGIADIIVAKNRHGEVGEIELHWDGAHTRFTEVDRSHQ
ncbi:MAG: replicative DNA helicase [Clostridia bacterium]|nr:replicative DNA helicase [Clostridia bacterium]